MEKIDEQVAGEKEVYRLWWEYLKRSEKYRALWDVVRSLNLHKKKTLNASQIKSIQETYKSKIEVDWNMHIVSTQWISYTNYFHLFGNVFHSEFEDIWSKGFLGLIKDKSEVKLPVVDLSKKDAVKNVFSVDTYIKNSDEYLDDYLEPEPRTMDIKRLIKDSVSYIFLGIPIVGTSNMKNIAAEIKDIRDDYMKVEKAKLCDRVMKKALAPSGYIRSDELKLYLQVYDLRKEGLTMPQVIKELKPEQSGDPVNVSRQFFSYQKKAKEIINNVENGYFPGKYSRPDRTKVSPK